MIDVVTGSQETNQPVVPLQKVDPGWCDYLQSEGRLEITALARPLRFYESLAVQCSSPRGAFVVGR
jgi:hypothetical protein